MFKVKAFFRAYIVAALWSSTDDDGEPLDAVSTFQRGRQNENP